MNPFSVPELSPSELFVRSQEADGPLLVDVREPHELHFARLKEDVLLVPLSELAANGPAALPEELQDREAKMVIICHHGTRSAQVVAWLRQQGWTNVYNLAGGIDAYAREIDPEIGFY